MAKNKLYWEKEKKREDKEEQKRKRKKGKKKDKKREEKQKRGEKQQKSKNKKQGGVSSGCVYCKSLDFPWNFPVLLGQLFFPLSV